MGIPDDEVEAADDDEGEELFAVWPENEHALKCFMLVRRMWRYGPMGGVLGLDRPNVESELRMRKIEIDAALLDDLAVMEGGAMEVLNAK